ncbi:MAG TPA: hypothetical protein VGE41_11420 [Verrucomicrobiae bacterium]
MSFFSSHQSGCTKRESHARVCSGFVRKWRAHVKQNRAPGVIAFHNALKGCEQELRSTLEDWILVGLRLGHKLPKLAGIDLNKQGNGRVASSRLSAPRLQTSF